MYFVCIRGVDELLCLLKWYEVKALKGMSQKDTFLTFFIQFFTVDCLNCKLHAVFLAEGHLQPSNRQKGTRKHNYFNENWSVIICFGQQKKFSVFLANNLWFKLRGQTRNLNHSDSATVRSASATVRLWHSPSHWFLVLRSNQFLANLRLAAWCREQLIIMMIMIMMCWERFKSLFQAASENSASELSSLSRYGLSRPGWSLPVICVHLWKMPGSESATDCPLQTITSEVERRIHGLSSKFMPVCVLTPVHKGLSEWWSHPRSTQQSPEIWTRMF